MESTVIKYGDNISTDNIIPGRFSNSLDESFLAEHCMCDLDASFTERIKQSPMIVAGSFFGIGSSREAAPVALKAAGTAMVFAKSYARIFFRNAVNTGLPLIECDTDRIGADDRISYSIGDDHINNLTTGEAIPVKKLTPFIEKIYKAGGMVPFFRDFGGY